MKEIKEMTMEELREELRKERENKSYWFERATKMEEDFRLFRETIKNITLMAEA